MTRAALPDGLGTPHEPSPPRLQRHVLVGPRELHDPGDGLRTGSPAR
ncbi:hypothetical protein NKG05_13810 [Oerskovia sp. M15]